MKVLKVCKFGGQAAAYVCLDTRKDERVFVKEYPPLDIDAAGDERLKREIGSLKQLRNPYMPRLKYEDFTAENPWLAMEFCDGENLHVVVRDSGPLTVEQVATHGIHVAEALDALHRAKLIHRDVKPSNVMLSGGDTKLVDLGIVGVVATADPGSGVDSRGGLVTRLGFQPGTPGFMSPEQERGLQVTAASDVYSLALTLCFAAGATVHGNANGTNNITVSGSHSSRELLSVLQAILHTYDPEERPPAAQLGDQLRSVLSLALDE
ncbi:MAG: serine/threonine-protein kinase [Actinomycetes bacterium]